MKKSDLKELIAPIVKECVQENIQAILLESGLLSQVISEVVKGLQPVLVESKQPAVQSKQTEEPKVNKMTEILKRSQNVKPQINLEGISRKNYGGVNIFEGISDTIPDETASAKPGDAMYGLDPSDPGVDINGLFNPDLARALMKGNKR